MPSNSLATSSSDWDIALQWRREGKSYMEYLACVEEMRQDTVAYLFTKIYDNVY